MGSEEIHALQGVSIEIERGEYVAIMGPSGSGKSTLMNLIGCLDTPSKGSYLLNDKEVASMNDDELARDPQRGDRLRLPDVQPAAEGDGAAQRRAAADLRRRAVEGRQERARQALEKVELTYARPTGRTSSPAVSGSASPSRGRW